MFNFFKKKENNENKQSENTLKNALSKTVDSLINSVISTVKDETITEFDLEDIETTLIKADLGIDLSVEIVEKLRNKNLKSSQLKTFLKEEFKQILASDKDENLKFNKEKLNVYFVVGVNGAGKTTLIGKLANRFKKEENKVLIVAGDTFRAAAGEQLEVWAQRANVDIIKEDNADSASLAYKAIDKARAENYNVIIIDSAGRLQNKFNLIEELKKIKNVINKKIENDNIETIRVLDGTQGQNGLNQAMVFNEAVEINSIAITKLDGTSKGGIIFSIAKTLNIPTKLIGIGEGIDDVSTFNKEDFINALFEEWI